MEPEVTPTKLDVLIPNVTVDPEAISPKKPEGQQLTEYTLATYDVELLSFSDVPVSDSEVGPDEISRIIHGGSLSIEAAPATGVGYSTVNPARGFIRGYPNDKHIRRHSAETEAENPEKRLQREATLDQKREREEDLAAPKRRRVVPKSRDAPGEPAVPRKERPTREGQVPMVSSQSIQSLGG